MYINYHNFLLQYVTDLWISATKFEIEVLKDVESARKIMQRAVRFNPTSEKLWLEVYCRCTVEFEFTNKSSFKLNKQFFRMELLFRHQISQRKTILEDKQDDDATVRQNVWIFLHMFHKLSFFHQTSTDDLILQGKLVLLVFRQAIKEIREIFLNINLLNRYFWKILL